VLVETYDGDLWIYDLDASAHGRLSGLRVGDEVILAFDDRIAGKRAIAINVVASGLRPLPPGMLTVADLLPTGAVFGAPAITPTYVAGGRAVYGPGMIGVARDGTVIAANGSTAFVSGGIVPGFGGISAIPAGVVSPQIAIGLGLVPGAFVSTGPTSIVTTSPGGAFTQGNFSPGSVAPGVTTANPGAMGRPTIQGPFTPGAITPGSQGGAALTTPAPNTPAQGNFTPGTVAPGVRTTSPGTPGQPVTTQGPFTPGTVAPGVSTQQGNAPPPAAGTATRGTAQPAPAPQGGTIGGPGQPAPAGGSMPAGPAGGAATSPR
jgi:hypothetical protein